MAPAQRSSGIRPSLHSVAAASAFPWTHADDAALCTVCGRYAYRARKGGPYAVRICWRRDMPPTLLTPEAPLQVPADREMLPSERRAFVRTHRTCIFGYARRSDGPAMSVVYYVPTDEDELLISTMAERAKARAVPREPKVSLCVLDETWPFTYMQVYCDAQLDTDPELAVDVMMAVGWRMSGQQVPDEARPAVEELARTEQRLVLRCRPYETFATPPRHLHSHDQRESLTHWSSASLPWGAADPPAAGAVGA